MRRIFICCSDPFPFGTANSNYIRNFSKCLKSAGYDVTVVGIGKNRKEDSVESAYVYQGIKYHNVDIPLKGAKNFLKAEVLTGAKMKSVLAEFGIRKTDYIFIYSSLFSVINTAVKLVQKDHVISIEVEWLQPFQYKKGKLDPMYIIWNTAFNYRLKRIQRFLPISTTLQKMMLSKGRDAVVMPVLTDSSEVKFESGAHVKEHGVLNLIYSGAATNKDSFPCMIKALAALSEEELSGLQLHFTSLTEEKLRECMCGHEEEVNKVLPHIVFHGWLEYQELLELYRKMDFTLLAREKNLATLSNFPSKIPELMAFGVIPLCSNVGDYTEIYLSDGIDSIQFEEDSVSSCNRAIKRALGLSDLDIATMKMNTRKCVEEKFDYINWCAFIRNFIQGK